MRRGDPVVMTPVIDAAGIFSLRVQWGTHDLIYSSGRLARDAAVVKLSIFFKHGGPEAAMFPVPFAGTAFPSIIVDGQGWPGGANSRNSKGPLTGWKGPHRLVWFTDDMDCRSAVAGDLDSDITCTPVGSTDAD